MYTNTYNSCILFQTKSYTDEYTTCQFRSHFNQSSTYVQNPRRCHKMHITSMHVQMYPRTYTSSHECHVKHHAYSLASRYVFQQQQLTRLFSLPGGESNLLLYVKSICWYSPPPQRWPKIAVKRILLSICPNLILKQVYSYVS